MPDDKGMADAITLYRSAIRYDQKYEEGEVPPKKQARPGENKRKRKRNYVENDHAGDAANPYPRRDAANP